MIAGILLGLIAGPLVLYALGILVLKIRGGMQENGIQKMKEEHNAHIKTLRKKYEADRKKFNKRTIKMQQIIAKAKERNSWA